MMDDTLSTMDSKNIRTTSDWKTLSELRPVQQNISEMGYRKEYIEKRNLDATKIFHWSRPMTGVRCYYEPIEVMMEGDKVLWRYNEDHIHMDIPEVFETQFGTFNNHNRGEFTSWLGKEDYSDPAEERKSSVAQDNFFVEGNYCDMFDCGEYVYAVSNLMHMGLGIFKIIRIDKNLSVMLMYENYRSKNHTQLEYLGHYKNADGYVVVVSGFRELRCPRSKNEYQDITILFQIDGKGNCYAISEWELYISSANSMVSDGEHIYFGQNKMITRLNIRTGEIAFFTNKTDEELGALVDGWNG